MLMILMVELLRVYEADSVNDQPDYSIPDFLCSKFERPDKEESHK